VIDQLAPDVLAVQEIGDEDALADLVERLDGDWHTQTSTFPDSRGIRVGFLSRLPLSEIDQARAFPERLAPIQVDDDGTTIAEMGRGALRVRVSASGRDVDLACCHLKSKLLTFPGGRFSPRDEGERARFAGYALSRRAAEAVTLRAFSDLLLDGHGRERAVIVLGDLNDEPQAATTQVLLGPPGSEIGTPGFDRPDQGEQARLYNLAPLIPAERRFSRVFRGRGELIDHILVSHALVNRVTDVDTGTRPPSITEEPTARRDEPGQTTRRSSRALRSTEASATTAHGPVAPPALTLKPSAARRAFDSEANASPEEATARLFAASAHHRCLPPASGVHLVPPGWAGPDGA
jgi:endonuclease/exonuclease/phosphatase family metal-dependent hydrolase